MSIGRSGFGAIGLWGDRALGRSGFGAIGLWGDRAYPQVRRGLKSPSNSESRLKPTEEPNQTIADFSPFDRTLGRSGLPTSPPGIEIPV
ncbi:hypothetical protein QUB36_16005 [Microcoleus sp. AT8-B1]|uniref:hypothetical protein n=1 Tax=unclassified Microcoleus TaxID=2642155 RepID=UPI002FD17225